MKVATWNVNSIRKRTGNLVAWLQKARPDVVVLQEIKAQEAQFPRLEVEAAGYKVEIVGQKGFNGVALLSLHPVEITARSLPDAETDEQARYIEGRIQTARGPLTVGGLYLPNGNPIHTDKFAYKIAWMDRLAKRARALLAQEEMFVLGGDYNVCPTDADVFSPAAFANDALCQPQSRQALRALLYLGLTDAVRAFHVEGPQYTYWDYQAGAWQKDNGLRIDHLLLSPKAADRLAAVGIDKEERSRPEPSDHVPVWCELDIG
ncbi:exodeoxyribonuclease III [Enhydrobacter sp.]|jgi:exodeoxyribonuclease-3|uniref:exodeoxyribonuclease III n=1 Tax=Enhydrobacter sp. TaxID=1894999 RepID=UPI00260F542B|nr:exodeoxyribonuclease III [Enhydrobacter sp.]WIM14056.1 MAG: Exodeoxyribonuclease III [Enhydrobacter sp.]